MPLFLGGCKATQEVTKFEAGVPNNMCIVKHEAVREGVLNAITEGLNAHGVRTKVVQGNYVEKHGVLNPDVVLEDVNDCGAVVFYTARWNWDLATYMSFANIWITEPTLQNKVAQATYVTGHGFDKFIDAREKILELIDSMVAPIV